jgi:hypothetical protein
MSIETLIREATSAYADTIEPTGESFDRIASRARGSQGRTGWLRYLPAAVAFAVATALIAVRLLPNGPPPDRIVPETATVALDATYTSRNGDLSFKYPQKWTLNDPDDAYAVFNFASDRLDDLERRNGEVLIKWGIPSVPQDDQSGRPKSTQDIFDRTCAGGSRPDCEMVDINGRPWVRLLTRGGYVTTLTLLAVADGKAYKLHAEIGKGDLEQDLVSLVERVFETVVVR